MARYPQRADLLPGLLETLKDGYLLLETDARSEPSAPPIPATRLAHDTLAPLVHERFRTSIAPGQRARRLLENRAPEWHDGKMGPDLDAADLSAVEAGAAGMRAWTTDEARLVEASRQAEERRLVEEEREKRQLWEAREREEKARLDEEKETKLRLKVSLAAFAVTAVFAALAFWQWDKSEKSAAAANIQKMVAQEQSRKRGVAPIGRALQFGAAERLDQAILLALEASVGDTLEARASLQRCIDDRPELSRFLKFPKATVSSVAFGPEGRIAAGYSAGVGGGGVVLFDAGGERLRPAPLEVKEGGVTSMAFGPDGRIAAGYSGGDGGGGVVLFDARRGAAAPRAAGGQGGRGLERRLWARGPDRRRIYGGVGTASAAVVLFDARGERLRRAAGGQGGPGHERGLWARGPGRRRI